MFKWLLICFWSIMSPTALNSLLYIIGLMCRNLLIFCQIGLDQHPI